MGLITELDDRKQKQYLKMMQKLAETDNRRQKQYLKMMQKLQEIIEQAEGIARDERQGSIQNVFFRPPPYFYSGVII